MKRVILLIGVLFFSVSLYIPPSTSGNDSDTKNDLETQKLKYELQERCGKRAAEWFKNEYGGLTSLTYQNHYNMKLNKCFVQIEYINTKGVLYLAKLMDVNENNTFGLCGPKKPDGGILCYVGDKYCKDFGEWLDLADIMMKE